MDTKTLQEQKAWEHYTKVEARNHELEKQILKQQKEIKTLKHHNRALIRYKKENEKRKEQNRGKRRGKPFKEFR